MRQDKIRDVMRRKWWEDKLLNHNEETKKASTIKNGKRSEIVGHNNMFLKKFWQVSVWADAQHYIMRFDQLRFRKLGIRWMVDMSDIAFAVK